MKAAYKTATGSDWSAGTGAPAPRAPKQAAEKPKKEAQQPKKKEEKKPEEDGVAGGLKKQTRLGLEAKKDENLADWYSQVCHGLPLVNGHTSITNLFACKGDHES